MSETKPVFAVEVCEVKPAMLTHEFVHGLMSIECVREFVRGKTEKALKYLRHPDFVSLVAFAEDHEELSPQGPYPIGWIMSDIDFHWRKKQHRALTASVSDVFIADHLTKEKTLYTLVAMLTTLQRQKLSLPVDGISFTIDPSERELRKALNLTGFKRHSQTKKKSEYRWVSRDGEVDKKFPPGV